MTAVLYQFPISHYCEKVRWALDYKQVPWRAQNLLPGLHIKTARGMAPRSSVPILCLQGECVQGSANIISWLDERFPERPLTPADPAAREASLHWESRLDRDLGVHVRRFAYHYLLDRPDLVIPLFVHQGRWWWRPFLKLSFPRLQAVMRKLMAIDDRGAEESRQVIEQTLADIRTTLSQQPWLAGDGFSRADLAATALAAPLFMPAAYGLPWPAQLPRPLQDWINAHEDDLAWARALYRDCRSGSVPAR